MLMSRIGIHLAIFEIGLVHEVVNSADHVSDTYVHLHGSLSNGTQVHFHGSLTNGTQDVILSPVIPKVSRSGGINIAVEIEFTIYCETTLPHLDCIMSQGL